MQPEDECPLRFEVGDDVEIVTTGLKGRIAGCDGLHAYFEVWIYGGGKMYGVPAPLLEFANDDEYHEPPERAEKDNVVNMADYKLTATSKTKGVA